MGRSPSVLCGKYMVTQPQASLKVVDLISEKYISSTLAVVAAVVALAVLQRQWPSVYLDFTFLSGNKRNKWEKATKSKKSDNFLS